MGVLLSYIDEKAQEKKSMTICNLWLRFACRLAIALGCCLPCFAQGVTDMPMVPAARLPDVGESAPGRLPSGNFQCVVNSAQTYPCYSVIVNKITYTVAFHERGSKVGKVADVRTTDKNFRTPEGLRIGDVITVRSGADLILAPYFAVYANHGTKWIPVVGFLDNVSIVQTDGEDKTVPLKDVEFNGSEIRVRISGFVQRKGVDPRSAAKD